MIGVDSMSAIQPSRSRPAASSSAPTIRASVTAEPSSPAPAAASAPSSAAKIGVMVESAPTVRTRLAPNRAKPRVAPMKA